jgi:hypothetical protein
MVALSKLETNQSREKYKSALYDIGTLAMTQALETPDLRKLINFFDHLGREVDWKDAFNAAFDVPFSEFEKRFNTRYMKMTRENPESNAMADGASK